jgi:O-antigen/teichoic acid export membrane protein
MSTLFGLIVRKGWVDWVNRLTGDAIFESGHLSRDLVKKSVRSGMVTMTARGVEFVLQLAGIMVLARLLTPNDYGLIGMVVVVISFAGMFKDAGLSMATVQKETISREQISTLFWLNVLISLFLGLCILAGSPLVARFYGRSELTTVTAALSLSFIISGLTIQHQALLRRHMRFESLAVIQIASYVANLIVAILLALAGWRYWALVGGTFATALSGTLLTFFFCPWIPGRMRRATGVRDMLKFGGHVIGGNFFDYFAGSADHILIGKFIGADALGLYAKAYRMVKMPITQIRGPMRKVALPVLSSLQNQPERYVKYYQRLIDIIASLSIPLTLYCAIEADFLIRILLGQQWLGVVPVFRILAIAGVIHPVASTGGLVLISHGFSSRFFYFSVFYTIVIVASYIAGLPFGIRGVAAGYAVGRYVILIPSLFYCFHKTSITVSLFMRTVASPMLSGLLAAGCVILMKYVGTGDSLVSHILYAGIFMVVYSGLSFCRKSVRETSGLLLKGLPVISRKSVGVA